MKLSGGKLTTTFDFADKPPTRSAESFGVFLLAANYAAGTGSYQAGATWEGGKTQGPFIMDLDSATQENYPATDITVSGNTITVAFDSEPFEKLGSGWQWRAAISLDGHDTDSCPGGVEDFLVYR